MRYSIQYAFVWGKWFLPEPGHVPVAVLPSGYVDSCLGVLLCPLQRSVQAYPGESSGQHFWTAFSWCENTVKGRESQSQEQLACLFFCLDWRANRDQAASNFFCKGKQCWSTFTLAWFTRHHSILVQIPAFNCDSMNIMAHLNCYLIYLAAI